MKINWKCRFKNKTWLTTFLAAGISFVYTTLSTLGIVPKISEDSIVQIMFLLVNLFTMLGIVIDPTTKGLSDSKSTLENKDSGQNLPPC